MHSNEEPTRAGGALSTEDLAQPPGAPAQSGVRQETTGPPAPVYPGESTGEATAPQPTPDGATGADTAGPAAAPRTADTAGPAGTSGTAATTGAPGDTHTQDAAEEGAAPALLTADEEQSFRDRWQEIQGRFVDDPREAVHSADGLVADVMRTLATTFARHKQDLEGQWSQGERVDTEDLRRALRRYRSFFNRLLST
ncbi:hypothetical protein [Streptomyces anandii]|uniref:hypothetical protein n=1 Tax=Streptomyces anandii TaxID=285454 RepID=UPI00167ABDAD|nr:hypothetical protein [Streptomyces anandii]GGX96598.1 hypothetical protein GCM10010510_47510 [Streptomyces anandii JCM 4720]